MLLKMTRKEKLLRLFADDDKFVEMMMELVNMEDPGLLYCDGKGECIGTDNCKKEWECNCIKRWLNEEILVEVEER